MVYTGKIRHWFLGCGLSPEEWERNLKDKDKTYVLKDYGRPTRLYLYESMSGYLLESAPWVVLKSSIEITGYVASPFYGDYDNFVKDVKII